MEHKPSAKKGKIVISSFFKKRDRQTSESSSIPTVTTVQHQYSETLSILTIQIPSIMTIQILSISSSQNEYHSSSNSNLQSSTFIERDLRKKKANM